MEQCGGVGPEQVLYWDCFPRCDHQRPSNPIVVSTTSSRIRVVAGLTSSLSIPPLETPAQEVGSPYIVFGYDVAQDVVASSGEGSVGKYLVDIVFRLSA